MKYFFEDIEKQNQLGRILESWVGTPFRHGVGVRGMGVDCIYFVTRVMEEMELGPFQIPEYSRDWLFHSNEELLLNGILKSINVKSLNLLEPLNGDIILFKFGRTNSHSAIFYKDHLYQAVNGIGVIKLHWLDARWHKRKRHALRILTTWQFL